MIAHAIRYPFALAFGGVMASLLIVFGDPLGELGVRLHDAVRPVVIEWTVQSAARDGDDLILSGTLVKQRACTFLPPTLARDHDGRNYAVVSGSATAGKTWAPSDAPQRWGPWRVIGGAGKQLTFLNVYLCGQSAPSVVQLGVYPGT